MIMKKVEIRTWQIIRWTVSTVARSADGYSMRKKKESLLPPFPTAPSVMLDSRISRESINTLSFFMTGALFYS